jgi:hypothetical protein
VEAGVEAWSAGFLTAARIGHFFTRSADMVKVFAPGTPNRSRPGRSLIGLLLVLTGMLLAPVQGRTQTGSAGKGGEPKASAGQAKAKAEPAQTAPAAADEPAKDDKQGDDQPPAEVPPDPSKTQRVSPVEIFKDPAAEGILDLKKFNPVRYPPARPEDAPAVKTMAQNPNMPVDSTAIRRMVNGMVNQLTETKNIQALIDPPPGLRSNSATATAIEEATSNLLEPLFVARANRSTRFLTEYNRVLLSTLPPLLKHHLIPRVQAMMVLAQSGNPDALKLFLDELKNPQQTVWVKLWALRGIANIKQNPAARLSADKEIEAARVITGFLDQNKDLPWPVQLRATEALTALRQGYVPATPKTADMAVSVMKVLTDPKARNEVRAEAARALGFMQITNAVSDYNFSLVVYAIGLLAADLGDQMLAAYSADTGAPLNDTKAQLMTSLLVGPVIQAFEGQQAARESGLLNVNGGNARGEVQKVLDQVRPVAAAALELLRAPGGQRKARRGDLDARVTALKEYLAKNAPANRHLVPNDEGFLETAGASAESPPAADRAKVAGAGSGR